MYWKYNSTTGGITIFGEKNDMSCEYACSSLNSDNPVWARLYNVSTHFQSLAPQFGSQENSIFDIHEIDEAEYKNHLRFASKILSDAIDGVFYPTVSRLNTPEKRLYDYSTYTFAPHAKMKNDSLLCFQLDVDSPFPQDYIGAIRDANMNAYRCLQADGSSKDTPDTWPGRELFMSEISDYYNDTLFTITCIAIDGQEWREYYYNGQTYSVMPEAHYPAFDKRFLKPITK